MRVPSLRAQQLQPPKPGASLATLSLVSLAATLLACADHRSPTAPASRAAPALEALLAGAPLNVPAQGQYIFRHWTFGDEPFWTDTLHLNQVVEAAVSPATALAVGLKGDADRLPPGFLARADFPVPPPAFGLRGLALETYTGEGPVSYWNDYVAVTQMHGHGSFSDPALGIAIQQTPDRVTPVLPVLRAYQLSLNTPPPPPGSFDRAAAERGQALFNATARCANCHIPSLAFTDVNLGILHDPAATGMEPVRASRLKNHQYRTTPLRALWQHPPYFHDGSAATLPDVVEHYDRVLGLGLSPQQKADLVAYLKSL